MPASSDQIIAELSELDGWPCDCGCGLVLAAVVELVPL